MYIQWPDVAKRSPRWKSSPDISATLQCRLWTVCNQSNWIVALLLVPLTWRNQPWSPRGYKWVWWGLVYEAITATSQPWIVRNYASVASECWFALSLSTRSNQRFYCFARNDSDARSHVERSVQSSGCVFVNVSTSRSKTPQNSYHGW